QLKDLYPPMRNLLSTPHAQAILKNAAQGQIFVPEKKRSVFTGVMIIGDHSFNVLKMDFLSSMTFTAKTIAAKELKAKFKKGDPSVNTNASIGRDTQTRGMIRALLKKDFKVGDDDKSLTSLLLNKSAYFGGKPQLLAQKLPFIKRI